MRPLDPGEVLESQEAALERIEAFHRDVLECARRRRLEAYCVMGCASYPDGMISQVAIGGSNEGQKRAIPTTCYSLWDYCKLKAAEEGELG